MSEGLILFLSVFLGIPAGGIVGALALKLLGSINNFYKRKELITNIRGELKLNLIRLKDLKEYFIENLEIGLDPDIYLTDEGKFISEMKKDFYNRYLNDFILLKDINVVNEIFRIYDFEYIKNSFKFFYYGLVGAIKMSEKNIEEAIKMELNAKELIKEDSNLDKNKIQKILDHVTKIKSSEESNIELIKSKTFKNIKNMTKEAIEDNRERIKKVIINLDKIYKQNIFIFWFEKNR